MIPYSIGVNQSNSLIYEKLSKLLTNDDMNNTNLLNKSDELLNYLEKNN